MSKLHQWKEWIAYKRKARSRHGIHSPFVYDFIEKALYKRNNEDLKYRIVQYFEGYDIIYNEWNLDSALSENTLIILEDIHLNTVTDKKWISRVEDPKVRLSIDLYSYGLLFFKNDFKEKQHFILKA